MVASLPPPSVDDEEEEMLNRAIAMSLEEKKCPSWIVPELD